jgi:hypothetical protein
VKGGLKERGAEVAMVVLVHEQSVAGNVDISNILLLTRATLP